MVLDKVKGHNEREILINKTGRDSDRDSDLETYDWLSRFKLAICYNDKKVSGFGAMVLDKVKGHNEREILINSKRYISTKLAIKMSRM